MDCAQVGVDMVFSIIMADIVTLDTEAIVNSAHTSLRSGSGLCGYIHAKAGPGLQEECLTQYTGCAVGEAVLTSGHNLKAAYVIHTVGPKWLDKAPDRSRLLYNCYANSLLIAKNHGIRTIAFPSISTGIHRYPLTEAAEVAVRATQDFLTENPCFDKIYLVCAKSEDYEAYIAAYQKAFVPSLP